MNIIINDIPIHPFLQGTIYQDMNVFNHCFFCSFRYSFSWTVGYWHSNIMATCSVPDIEGQLLKAMIHNDVQ